MQNPSPFPVWRVAAAASILIVGLIGIPNLVENLDATRIMVIQSPVSGELTWHTDQGVKWQGFGKITKYAKREQFTFEGDAAAIRIRFNDGGHALLHGSLAWEMPVDTKSLTAIHQKYGGQTAVENQLIRTVVEKAIYMAGPLLSSKESYAEKRNELLRYIDDQISNGVYMTETQQVKEPDPMTGALRTVAYVRIMEKDGVKLREDVSALREFGIRTFNLSIKQVAYDPTVEQQIQTQQQAVMQVQTAMAAAKQAEQAAITAEKHGEAEAAKAKWAQEVIKAQQVTEAEQKLAVAKLDKEAADQERQRQILLGQGEAQRRRLVMEADGALEKKLDAWVQVNSLYAAALKDIKQPIVPQVVTGGGSGSGGSGGGSSAVDLIEMLKAKTAHDLGVSIGAPASK